MENYAIKNVTFNAKIRYVIFTVYYKYQYYVKTN